MLSRRRHIVGRFLVGLMAFGLTSILSLKPRLDVVVTPQPQAANAWVRAQQGFASFYARHFHGRLTASGIRFDNEELVAAHPEFPFGTVVRVTNLVNGRSVQVRIIDRGPARGPRQKGVVIDLSRAAARALDFIEDGRARVRLDILAPQREPPVPVVQARS